MKEKFNYNYTYEVSSKNYTASYEIFANNKGILNLVLSGNYIQDYDVYSLISKLGYIEYTVDDSTYKTKISNKSPNDYKDGLYLAVDSEMINASSIKLVIIIRNKKYIYVIK